MKCWIKRFNEDDEFRGYFSKNLDLKTMSIHWVQDRKEAKRFFDGRIARGIIRRYKLKNCKVEYDGKINTSTN